MIKELIMNHFRKTFGLLVTILISFSIYRADDDYITPYGNDKFKKEAKTEIR